MVGAKANTAADGAELIKSGLPPIARSDARLFILGSLPGDASLAARRYYAHPSNQFWRLVGTIVQEDLHSLDYSERLGRLAAHRIGLWDVIASGTRRGSLDQAIRDPQHNELQHLLTEFQDLRAIAFNGGTAAVAGRRLIGQGSDRVALVDLPSSSAANTRSFAEKAAAWSAVAHFLQP